jgi:flagellar motor switch protein FliN/FliY
MKSINMNDESLPSRVAMAKSIKLVELSEPEDSGRPLLGSQLDLIRGVKVRLSVSVGQCELSVAELLALKDGAVLKLDRLSDAAVDIFLEDKLVGRGDLVVVDDSFGVRITELGSSAL